MTAPRSSGAVTQAHLIVNPAAGRGVAGRAADAVARAFRGHGWKVELARTEAPGHATTLAAAICRAGARRVIAVGGDGTVHEVANGMIAAGTDAALGVVPIGSGDDFAKLVGTFRLAPEAAVARIVTGVPRRFDAGRAAGEYFVNSMGVGFGAAVVRRRNAMAGLSGFLSYLVPIVRTFATFRPPRLEVAADGHREAGEMMMIEVCNGTTAGGSYRFAPDADPADGRLDVCLVRRVSPARFLVAMPRVMRGRHLGMREFGLYRTARVTIRCPDGPLVLHLDGELREPGTAECMVEVVPGALAVLAAR
jgi:YegS/Rv2252/BmrU family lipid kinase